MSITTRDKIAHLLRRFAFGPTESELSKLLPLGVEGALEALLNFESTDEAFPISAWEFCREPNKTEFYTDGYRISEWWALRMLMSKHPLEQRLTYFWHSHFAVAGNKVDFGPMLLAYLETLRTHALGDFPSLLKAISKEPAMLRYLDGETSLKDHPNENFARELFELFCLGKDNYTEQDIREAARVFAGWGNRYLLFEMPGEDNQVRIQECIKRDIPLVTSSFSPSLADHAPKTIFGRTENFDTDSFLSFVAQKPQTAYFITNKLWKYFSGVEPTPKVENRLANAFSRSGGSIRSVLKEIIRCDEFWAPECMRQKVRSPLDFVVPILRQFNLQPILLAMHAPAPAPDLPVPKPLRDASGLALLSMQRQGLLLLFPPNVAGWPEGTAWISPNNLIARAEFANLLFGVNQPDQPLADYMAKQLLESNPLTSYNTIIKFLDIFDAKLPAEKQYLLIQAFEKEGGMASLTTSKGASRSLGAVARLLFASPEFQFC